MSRTTERNGTKSNWRFDKQSPYGIAAHRRVRESNQRALMEHEAAQKRKEG